MWGCLKRLYHDLHGHPSDQVVFGSFLEGATCQCGTTFYLWDMQG